MSDPVPPKRREPVGQLVHALAVHGIDAVLDVGANTGQYGRRLRKHGWSGPILSFEPLPDLRDALARAVEGDPGWTVAPAVALGESDGTAVLERSAESDMSSLLAQSPTLRRISPSAAVVERVGVALRRLDGIDLVTAAPWRRMLLKIDAQGAEGRVLDGTARLWPRIAAVQLELSLVALYDSEPSWRLMVERMEALGFTLGLVIPGYYEHKLGRQLQFDGVFWREPLAEPAADRRRDHP